MTREAEITKRRKDWQRLYEGGERGRNHREEETGAEITEGTVLYAGLYRPYIPVPSVLYDGSVQVIITCPCILESVHALYTCAWCFCMRGMYRPYIPVPSVLYGRCVCALQYIPGLVSYMRGVCSFYVPMPNVLYEESIQDLYTCAYCPV